MKKEKIGDSERRKYVRLSYPFFIRVRKKEKNEELEKSGQPVIAFKEFKEDNISISKNISVQGICFTTSKDYPIDTPVVLEIFSPTRKIPFNMLAKVKWRNKRVAGKSSGYVYDTGVEFLKIDADGEFHDLLEHLVDSKLERVRLD